MRLKEKFPKYTPPPELAELFIKEDPDILHEPYTYKAPPKLPEEHFSKKQDENMALPST